MPEKVEAGCLLIASPTLQDPNFARTVVLLCEHGDEGSVGLVLNRPSEFALSEALSGLPDLPRAQEQTLFWGGPVQPQLVLVLHRSAVEAPGGRPLPGGMGLGGDTDDLAQVLQRTDAPEQHVRVFAGYAGWGAGQLKDEMRGRSWLTTPADARLIFETDPDDIWENAIRALGPRFQHLARVPLDPRVN